MVINFYTVTCFINFLTSAILAIFVILKNKKDQKNIAFFLFSTTVALWSLSYFFWQNVTDNEWFAIFWIRTLSIFLIMIPATYFHFVLAVTEMVEKRMKTLIFVYTVFYLFLLANATPLFVNKVEPIMNFKYWPVATPLFSAYFFCFGLCVVYSFFLLVKKYRSSVGIIRSQIKYVALGTIIGFVSGSSSFLPWYKIEIPPLGNALVPVYVLCIAYAISRYKLMNINILLRNLIFYFLIATFLYAIFYVLAFLFETIFGSLFSPEAYFVGLFTAPLVAVLLNSASNVFSVYVNKYLFPYLYNYQQAIKEASYELSRNTNLDDIAHTLSDIIKKTIQPIGIAILFFDPEMDTFRIVENSGFKSEKISTIDYSLFNEYFRKNLDILTREGIEELIQNTKDREIKMHLHEIENQIHQNNIYVCTPLRSSSELLGIIIVDAKQYENAYSKEDFDLLETVSHYAQISMENIILYKKIEDENYRLKNNLVKNFNNG